MNVMTPTPVSTSPDIAEIAEQTSDACLASRVRQLSRIVTRVYDDAMRPLGITASQFTLLTQLGQQDGITAVEIGYTLDIEKSTLSRNLKRLLTLDLIDMEPPAGRRGRYRGRSLCLQQLQAQRSLSGQPRSGSRRTGNRRNQSIAPPNEKTPTA